MIEKKPNPLKAWKKKHNYTYETIRVKVIKEIKKFNSDFGGNMKLSISTGHLANIFNIRTIPSRDLMSVFARLIGCKYDEIADLYNEEWLHADYRNDCRFAMENEGGLNA
jgi:hypothetical protein